MISPTRSRGSNCCWLRIVATVLYAVAAGLCLHAGLGRVAGNAFNCLLLVAHHARVTLPFTWASLELISKSSRVAALSTKD